MAEPASKKARVAEEIEEVEVDAPTDTGAKIQEPPTFHVQDTTMNVMQSGSNIIMNLTDGGLQYFVAGARANIGIKSGRYLFEAKILELMGPAQEPAAAHRASQPCSQFRIGLSTAATNPQS